MAWEVESETASAWEIDAEETRATPLPKGVAPSTAGAGRGDVVTPPLASQVRTRGGLRSEAQPFVAQEPATPDMPTDEAIRDAADPFARAKLLDQKAQATPRTTGDLVGDVGQAALRGAMRTAQVPSALYGLATGNTDNPVNRFFDQGVEASRALRSDRSQADAAALEAKIGAAEGWQEKLAVAMFETLQDPGVLLETGVESVPQMLGGAGAGRLVEQGVRKGAAALAVRALAGDSAGLAHAAVAASRAAQAAPVAGAVGTGAVAQGQDAAADTFREAMKMMVAGDADFDVPPDPRYVALRQQGMNPSDAHRAVAQQIAQRAGLMAGGISVGAQMLPGGRAIETAFLRKPTQQAARGGALNAVGDRAVAGIKETGSEGFEEAGSPLSRDVALDRSINTGDVAAAFGQGAAAGGPLGAIAGRGLPTPDKALRPTEQRKQAFDALDDYVAEHAMPPKLAEAIRKQAELVPLAKLPGFIERAKESLAKRGLWRGPVGPTMQTAAETGRPVSFPGESGPRPDPAATTDAIDAAELLGPTDDGSGLAEPSAVDIAARETATSPHNDRPEPSQAQKDAGVYKMGHTRVGPLRVTVENDAGSVRRGVDEDDNPWETTMQDHYTYIKGTVAYDSTRKKKQGVDLFIVPGTPDDYRGPMFVIDQINPKTGEFDEHKTVAGASSEAEAEAVYRRNYAADWQGFGGITRLPMPAFDAWVHSKAPSKGALGELNAANPARDGRSQPADLGRSPGSEQLRDQQPADLPVDARPADAQGVGGLAPAGLRPGTAGNADALNTPAAGPAATQETRNEDQSTQASPEFTEAAAEAKAQPLRVLGPPDVVWNGVGKKGMLEHAARQQMRDVDKRFPGMTWEVVKAPEFGPYAFKLEGRKQSSEQRSAKPVAESSSPRQEASDGGVAPTQAGAAPNPKPGRLTPIDEPRLQTPEGRTSLESARSSIGWDQVGGRMIRTGIAEPGDGGMNGPVVGRTPWIGSDLWRNRPDEGGKITEADGKAAINNALAGKPMTQRQKRFVQYALDRSAADEQARAEARLQAAADERRDKIGEEAWAEEQAERAAIMAENEVTPADMEATTDDDIAFDWPDTTKEAIHEVAQAADDTSAQDRADETRQDGPEAAQALDETRSAAPGDQAEGLTAYDKVLAETEARSQRFGRDKITDETRNKLAGMVLGREFGESMDDFLARNPAIAEKRRAYTDWLAGKRPTAAPGAAEEGLTAPTPESLQSAEDRAKAAAKAETAEQARLTREAAKAREKAELSDRTRQDASADAFELGQSKADVVAAMAGNGDLFAQPTDVKDSLTTQRPTRSAAAQQAIDRMKSLTALRACLGGMT